MWTDTLTLKSWHHWTRRPNSHASLLRSLSADLITLWPTMTPVFTVELPCVGWRMLHMMDCLVRGLSLSWGLWSTRTCIDSHICKILFQVNAGNVCERRAVRELGSNSFLFPVFLLPTFCCCWTFGGLWASLISQMLYCSLNWYLNIAPGY